MESKYYVVKLSEPSNHIDSAVCVPRSWIKIILDKTPEDQKVLISYPEEEPQKIKKRVETEEGSDKSWKHYWGTVVYTTDDYEDAERWITSSGISSNDNTGRGYPYIGNPPAQAAEREAYSYQQNTPATSRENTSQRKDVPLKNNSNASIKLSLKRNLLSNNADEFYIKQLRIDEKVGNEVPNHLCKPTVDPKELINIHQNVTHQEPRNQDIIPTAPVVLGPYQSPHQTAMPSDLQTSPNSHDQSCQLTDKLSQNCGTQKVDIRRTVHQNQNGQGSYFDVTHPIIQASTNSPSRSFQASELNQKRISVVPNEYLFQNTQEVSHERVTNTNSNHGKPYTDVTNTQSAMLTSPNYPNHLCQSSECSHKKQRQISNDYIVQNLGQQKLNFESSSCVNDSNQITNSLIRNTPSATQALKSLMNRRDEQRIPENQILTRDESTLYEKSPTQDVNGGSKSHEIYHIDQKTNSEDVKKTPKYSQQLHVKDRLPELDISQTFQINKNTSSPNRTSFTHDKKPPKYILKKSVSLEDNLSEITSKSCQLVEQSHLKQDASGYNVHVHINKIVVGRSKHPDYSDNDQTSLPEFVTKHSLPTVQNTSTFEKESSLSNVKSHQNQDSSEYKVVVQQHPVINKIIITKSNEMDANNETHTTQTNNSYGQNAFNVVGDCQSNDRSHEKNYTTGLTGYSQCNPEVPKRIVRTTTAGVPYIVNDYFHDNVKNGPSTIQHCSNLENHSFPISKHLNNQHTTAPQNCSTQVPHRDMQTAVGRSGAADRIDQRPRLQSIRKHKSGNTPSFIENKLGQFAERLHENQALLMGNDHIIQNHGTGVQLARQSRNMNHYDQRTCFRDPTKTINPPNHIPQHMQHPPNQTPRHSMQMPQHLNEKHFTPVHTNHVVPDQRIPQTHFVRPTIMNNIHQRSQPTPQNMPVVHNVPNSGNHFCCSCKCSNSKHMGSVVQEQSYVDPRMPHTYVGRTNDGHYIKQSVHPPNNTQNAPCPVQNPFNTPIHSSAAYNMNPIQENCLPIAIDHTVQETSPRVISATRYAEDNCAEQSIYNESNKEIRQHTHKSPSENHPSHIKIVSGQNMQTEDVYIEDTNNTNFIRQNSHPTNSAEIPSTTRQDTSNTDNMTNSKAIAEHALMKDLKSIIQKMDSNLCKTYTLIDNANRIFVEYAESFKKTMKVVNEYYELKINEATTTASMNAKRAKDKRHKKKRLEKARTDEDEHSNTI